MTLFPVADADTLPALALRRLVFGHRVTRIVAVAAQLGLADHLVVGPKNAAELATLVQADASALHRLLRALTGVGVLAEVDGGRFALTPLGQSLRADVPVSMRASALVEAADYRQVAWGDLLHSVRTGEVAFGHALGSNFYTYLEKHPDAGRAFSESMKAFAGLAADAVVAAYDFSPFQRIADVGGGYGRLIASILHANPHGVGLIFDLPAVVEPARRYLEEEGLAQRCDVLAGDYFESVPLGWDVYILSRIVMAYEDEPTVRILEKCREAMERESRLLLVQQVMPELGDEPASGLLLEATMSDLNMLVLTGGRERTLAEYQGLLEAAGLELTSVVKTQSLMSVIEAAVK